MWNREQAVGFAEQSASAAIDQLFEYEDSVASHEDNLIDSMNEQGVNPMHQDLARNAYWARLRHLADNPNRWMNPERVDALRARLLQAA